MSNRLPADRIEDMLIVLRGQKVLLDRDVARIYGVETKRVNEAVKNNPDKFPDGYVLALNPDERLEVVENFDHLKYSHVAPTAFTERGLYMLATILKSPQATEATISIIEAYANLRELGETLSRLPDAQSKNEQRAIALRGADIMAEILDDAMETTGTETSIEVNFAVMKVRHTVKRSKREQG